MNLVVIHNQKSGGGGQLHELQAAFKEHKMAAEFVAISDPSAAKTVQKIIKSRGAVVVAAGGDGTVQFAARLVQDTSAKLGIIPLGTLNHFAKDMGVPLNLNDAVAAIKKGKAATADAAEVNGELFINNSSIGLYPRSLQIRKKYRHRIGNIPAAIISMVRVLARPRRYKVTLKVDGKNITRHTPFVFVGNNTYKMRGNEFLNRPRVNEGTLAIYIIKAMNPWRMARMFIVAAFTKKRRTQDLDVFYAKQCAIHSHHKKLAVAFDGEVTKLHTPLHYKTLPKTLHVIVG